MKGCGNQKIIKKVNELIDCKNITLIDNIVENEKVILLYESLDWIFLNNPFEIFQGGMLKQTFMLISGSRDGAITFWNLEDMTSVKTVETHSKKVDTIFLQVFNQFQISKRITIILALCSAQVWEQ